MLSGLTGMGADDVRVDGLHSDIGRFAEDPLVRLVMRSDNVSETDHSALLRRVREALLARTSLTETASQRAL